MLVERFRVDSPHVDYGDDEIAASYTHENTELDQGRNGEWIVRPTSTQYEFRTSTRVPKLGCA